MPREYGVNFRAPKVDVHEFAMVPRAEIPRSKFRMQNRHLTTISASYLYPVFLQEVLPGDSFSVKMQAMCRLSTPLFPFMDQMELESFFFFVPCRLVWNHWYKFMGEQDNPTDSISFAIPVSTSPAGGYAPNSLQDYFGLPTSGQVIGGDTVQHSCLPLRAYNLIWNQWFRDENLQTSTVFGASGTPGPGGAACMDDGPDNPANYNLQGVCRRHDYFTSCLPWTQKGGVAVSLPLGTSATVRTQATNLVSGVQQGVSWIKSTGANPTGNLYTEFWGTGLGESGTAAVGGSANSVYPANLYADLSTATAATINQIRLAFQTQKLLERDARGGTRYTEIILAHFGVRSPDMRLQRPEYLGGGRTPVNMAPVPQTTATGLTGGSSPLGTLAGVGTVQHRSGFSQSFTEHGYILGLVTVRATQVYQQGLRKLWSRSTRYDFYFPVFAALGEQAVLNQEIYIQGVPAQDQGVFGYQERWAEYRYHPSYTSGFFKSTSPTPLDAWHIGIKYASLPVLNASFITDATRVTLERNLALAAGSEGQQFLCDFFFDERVARPMPMYSVPGLIDHF